MEIGYLLNELIEKDKDGKMINGLIEQGEISVNDIVNYVCGTNNYRFIYYVSKYVKNADISRLEDKILNISNVTLILNYLKDIPGVNVKKFEDKFIESNNARDICLFSLTMASRGIDVSRLENKLYELGSLNLLCDFVRGVDGSDINRLHSLILNQGKSQNLYVFANIIKNMDNDRISLEDQKKIIDDLTIAMIKTNDVYWISMFSKVINPISVDTVIELIKNNSNIDFYKLIFVIDIYGDDYISKIINDVSEYLNVDVIYDFLIRRFSKLDENTKVYLFDLIVSKSLENDDVTYIEMFMENYKINNDEKMENVKTILIDFYNRVDDVKKNKGKKMSLYQK